MTENLHFSKLAGKGAEGGAMSVEATEPLTVSKSKTDAASGDEEMQPDRHCVTLLPRCSTSVDLLSHSHLYDMCHKLSANIHHYSHVFQEMASPLIARYNRWRSRSQTREDAASGDTIELCHLNGFFLKVVRDGDRGHKFVAVILQSPTWCDACGQTLLGVYRRFLRCKLCCYTCHVACHNRVNIVCPDVNKSQHQSRYRRETSLIESCPGTATLEKDQDSSRSDDMSSGASFACSSLDLNIMISRFNDNKHGLVMELANDDFKGFIRVHLNVCRPISMCLSARPPSIYDILTHNEPMLDYRQVTSFYLPRDTSTVLHIKDTTTVQEVITILLQKFNITDDPRKFCLYHRSQKCSQNAMRKLGIYELPLVLCLYWTSQEGSCGLDSNKFVLQENDTGDIMWDVFSIPELENFLIILNREEEEYLERLKSKYTLLRIHMQRRLRQLRSENASERKNVLDFL